MCSSDFVFRKYKQDSAFHVSDVLQLANTGPPVTKNFPLLRLFPADAIAHFADMAAILNSIVLNVHYGMLRGQINMYLPPEHPIIDI